MALTAAGRSGSSTGGGATAVPAASRQLASVTSSSSISGSMDVICSSSRNGRVVSDGGCARHASTASTLTSLCLVRGLPGALMAALDVEEGAETQGERLRACQHGDMFFNCLCALVCACTRLVSACVRLVCACICLRVVYLDAEEETQAQDEAVHP